MRSLANFISGFICQQLKMDYSFPGGRMNTLVQKSQVIESWYRESEEFSTLVYYRILRAE